MRVGCMLSHESAFPLEGRFEGPSEFAQALRGGIQLARTQQWKHMVWCDVDFVNWPLREKAVVEALHEWAGAGRTLTLLAKRYQQVTLLHPRFVQWRVTWSHLVDARVVKHLDDAELPSAFLGPQWYLHRRDPVRSVGVWGQEPRSRFELKETLDECFRQSSPGFPASTLGL